jgi:hypothetical protein
MLRIPHCLDSRLTVNCEILATCSSTYSPLRTSQDAHSVSIRSVCPSIMPWRPIGMWDIESPTLSRQSAHRWRLGCKPYASAALYSQKYLLVLISVRGRVNSRVIVQLEGFVKKKIKSITSSGLESASFLLVAYRLNHYATSSWI